MRIPWEDLQWEWLAASALVFGAMTFVFPALGAMLGFFRSRGRSKPSDAPLDLEILVPCYNEADTITPTLTSLVTAAKRYAEKHPRARLCVTVALDGSTDGTKKLVEQFMAARKEIPIRLIDRGKNLGKWATLEELAAQSTGTWCAFVDAGTLWPEELLLGLADSLKNPALVGVAPGYRQLRGGKLEHLNWWIERTLKVLENRAGGPVSLHGATMFFRREPMKQAFAELGGRGWLNDDVVLALTMRKLGPILYLGDRWNVSDCGIREGGNEVNRRKRMMLGNVEWIGALFPGLLRHAPLVALLSLRRIVRVLWAYDLLVAGLFFGFFLNFQILTIVFALLAAVALFLSNGRLRQAGFVSLAAPYWIFRRQKTLFWT